MSDDRTVNGVNGDLSNADWKASRDAWKSEALAAADLAASRVELRRLAAESAARRS